MDAVLLHVNGFVRMPAEDSIRAALPRIGQRSRRDFRRHAQPPRVQTVNQPRDRITLQIHLLQLEIKRRAQLAEPDPVHLETVELVTVNRDMP
jgi:hypothetical protein